MILLFFMAKMISLSTHLLLIPFPVSIPLLLLSGTGMLAFNFHVGFGFLWLHRGAVELDLIVVLVWFLRKFYMVSPSSQTDLYI